MDGWDYRCIIECFVIWVFAVDGELMCGEMRIAIYSRRRGAWFLNCEEGA